MPDQWADKTRFACATCQWYARKERLASERGKMDVQLGRCRRHAPTLGGYPVVYQTDWCGDHKLGMPPR